MTDVIDRLPPNNPEAEEAVLGSLLMDPEAGPLVFPWLRKEDFYRERNGVIYEAVHAVYERHEPVDFVTVTDELKRQGRYDEIGGINYLSHLVNVVPTAVHVEHYGRIVERTSLKRQLVSAAGKMAAVAYDDTLSAEDTILKSLDLLTSVQARTLGTRLKTPQMRAARAIEMLEEAAAGEIMGIPTGLCDLDRDTWGLHPKQVTVLAARPSMGKTSCACGWARHQAERGYNVVIASLEQSDDELIQRDIAAMARKPWRDIITAQRDGMDAILRDRTSSAIYRLGAGNLNVLDEVTTFAEIRAEAMTLRARGELDVLYIDYLQLLADHGKRSDTENDRIEQLTRDIKALAKKLDIPIVVLSQLNRDVDNRPDNKRPILSDLRASGGIEQNADNVLFLYREDYYRPDPNNAGLAEILIAKQRNGPRNVAVPVRWLPELCSYVSAGDEMGRRL